MIIGTILLLAGVASLVFGYMQNNSLDAQLNSLLSSGSTNPGTIFIIVGVVLAALGLILILRSGKNKKS